MVDRARKKDEISVSGEKDIAHCGLFDERYKDVSQDSFSNLSTFENVVKVVHTSLLPNITMWSFTFEKLVNGIG